MKGITLTELLIALSLVLLVALAATSIDLASRRFLSSASRESDLQNELNIAMEHIVRNISRGVGKNDGSNDWVYVTAGEKRIVVRIDSDGDGKPETTDTKIAYRRMPNDAIRFIPDDDIYSPSDPNTYEDTASFDKLTLSFSQPDAANMPNLIKIEITGEKDGEQMTLESQVFMRGFSLR